jgi:hypothetical protein
MSRTTFTSAGFHEDRPELLVPVRLDPTGAEGPTPKQARGPRFRRTSWGLYVSAEADSDSPEQRIVEAHTAMLLNSWVTGWAALRWHGGYWFDGLQRDGRTRRPVPVLTTIDQTPPDGVRLFRELLPIGEQQEVDGLPVTSPVRSLFHEVRRARSLRDAVWAIEMAAYNDLVSVDEFLEFVAWHKGWPGVVQGRAAARVASENSLSPKETDLNWLWVVEAGLPSPLRNVSIFDLDGRHLGTPDFLDEQARLVVEYDGKVHLEARRRRKDRDREEAFRRAGLDYLTVLAGDRDESVVQRLKEIRRRALASPDGSRGWTLEQPHWWVPTETVTQRRALLAHERAIWLNVRLQP